MSRREPEGAPWTPEEDIFLTEGFAAFHDERTNQPDFLQIRQSFPFHEDRKHTDLSDRWREINEHLDTEDQELIARMRASSKAHRPQTWTYKYEQSVDLPPLSDILDGYRAMPSLALKTQVTESSIGRFATESRNVNEACLNHQFDAVSINHIVQDALQKIVDDAPLRDTLTREFRSALVRRGREFGIVDTARKLEIINEMRDHAAADQERLLMADSFERILTGVQMRTNRQGTPEAVLDDCLSILAALAEISWPSRPSSVIDSLQKEFKKRYVQTTTTFLRFQSQSPLIAQLLSRMTEIDRGVEVEQRFDQLKTHILNFRRPSAGPG
jgi:hypothetical protein